MATDFDRDDRFDGLLRETLRSQSASGPCVDAAMLAAWAEGALTPEETAALDAHLATCARCREMAATLSTMEAEHAPAAVVVPFTPRSNGRWKMIAGAMGAVAASALIWVAMRDDAPTLDSTSAVNRANDSQVVGMGGSVSSPAPSRPAESASALQPRADVASAAERLQGRQGQQARSASPLGASGILPEKTARAAEPSPMRASPSPVPIPPPPAPMMGPPPPATMPPPPSPPPAPMPAATAGAARSSTVTGLPQSSLNIDITGVKPADPAQGGFFATAPIIAEFVAGADLSAPQGQGFGATADRTSAGGAGRGGGGRGGAGAAAGGRAAGGAVAGGAAQGSTAGLLAPVPVRWRVRGAMPDALAPAMAALERSNDAGATWQPVPIPVLTTPLLTAGTAPTNSVCWLVGRTGTVLLSTDGTTFRQVAKPVDADLVSVLATDARSATVRTADGRTFATTDGGLTWTPAKN